MSTGKGRENDNTGSYRDKSQLDEASTTPYETQPSYSSNEQKRNPHEKDNGRSIFNRFVVCCDGTMNESQVPTNVFRISEILGKEKDPTTSDPFTQKVYYQPGIGTKGNRIRCYLNAYDGREIGDKICDAWKFLIQNWSWETYAHNEIILVGFSRGGFTVQCLANLLNDSGILFGNDQVEDDDIKEIYQDWKKKREKYHGKNVVRTAELGQQKITIASTAVKAIAIWDSVAALKSEFELSHVKGELCGNIAHAYHALSLHERRKDFMPVLWYGPTQRQVLKQVWFPGYHSHVGGGELSAKSYIPDITLLWMAEQLRPHARINDEELNHQLSGMSRVSRETFKDSLKGIYKYRLKPSKDRQKYVSDPESTVPGMTMSHPSNTATDEERKIWNALVRSAAIYETIHWSARRYHDILGSEKEKVWKGFTLQKDEVGKWTWWSEERRHSFLEEPKTDMEEELGLLD